MKIRNVTHSQYSIQVLDAIFDTPIFQTGYFIQRSGMTKPTAMAILRQLKDAGILVTLREASGRRPSILSFPALLRIAEGA